MGFKDKKEIIKKIMIQLHSRFSIIHTFILFQNNQTKCWQSSGSIACMGKVATQVLLKLFIKSKETCLNTEPLVNLPSDSSSVNVPQKSVSCIQAPTCRRSSSQRTLTFVSKYGAGKDGPRMSGVQEMKQIRNYSQYIIKRRNHFLSMGHKIG